MQSTYDNMWKKEVISRRGGRVIRAQVSRGTTTVCQEHPLLQQDVEPRSEDPRGEPAETKLDLDLVVKHDDRALLASLAVHARERRKAVEENYGDMVVLVAALSQDGRKYRRSHRTDASDRLRGVL